MRGTKHPFVLAQLEEVEEPLGPAIEASSPRRLSGIDRLGKSICAASKRGSTKPHCHWWCRGGLQMQNVEIVTS